MNLSIGTNIIPSINFIMSSVPDGLTDLEKIRYLYIELGKVFSYDYRIILDESVVDDKVNYESNEISRYKTCYQISEILSILVKGLIPNCDAKVVERKIIGRSFHREHVATEVNLKNGLNLLLDLTLDLANIQAGMRTKEFGFSTNANGDYDIISLKECEKMDKKLGFVVEKYMDDYIDEFKEKINQIDFGNKTKDEIVNYKISKAKEELFKNFPGCHEAVRYVHTVFTRILDEETINGLTQYNLSYGNTNEMNLLSIYAFQDLGLYYSYSNDVGLNKITSKTIQELFKNGWKTNSNSIQSIFADKTLIKTK